MKHVRSIVELVPFPAGTFGLDMFGRHRTLPPFTYLFVGTDVLGKAEPDRRLANKPAALTIHRVGQALYDPWLERQIVVEEQCITRLGMIEQKLPLLRKATPWQIAFDGHVMAVHLEDSNGVPNNRRLVYSVLALVSDDNRGWTKALVSEAGQRHGQRVAPIIRRDQYVDHEMIPRLHTQNRTGWKALVPQPPLEPACCLA